MRPINAITPASENSRAFVCVRRALVQGRVLGDVGHVVEDRPCVSERGGVVCEVALRRVARSAVVVLEIHLHQHEHQQVITDHASELLDPQRDLSDHATLPQGAVDVVDLDLQGGEFGPRVVDVAQRRLTLTMHLHGDQVRETIVNAVELLVERIARFTLAVGEGRVDRGILLLEPRSPTGSVRATVAVASRPVMMSLMLTHTSPSKSHSTYHNMWQFSAHPNVSSQNETLR